MRWNVAKNESLEVSRGVTFEAVVVAVEAGGLLDVVEHPNVARYPSQRVLVVAVDDYVHLVPFVEERDYVFLKTIIPSRKATRDYLGKWRERGVHAPADGSAEDLCAGRGDAESEAGRRQTDA